MVFMQDGSAGTKRLPSLIKQFQAQVKRTSLGDALVRRMHFYYLPALRVFRQLTHAGLEERKAFAQMRLAQVLARARKTTYGRQVGRTTELEAWPFLGKDAVRQNPQALLAAPVWLTIPASTSGTTGLPLKLFRSYASVAVEQAALDWLYEQAGLNPRTCKVAVLRGENIKPPDDMRPPFWRFDAAGKRMVMSSNHLNTQTLFAYYEALQGFQPDCLWAYPTSLDQLCRLMVAHDLSLKIPLVITSSEMLGSHSHQLVRQALHAQLIDYYGQAERVNFAYSPKQGAYFFLPGYSWNELLFVQEDEQGALYEIVGTNLWNLTMPLVRYRTGDYVRFPQRLRPEHLEAICFGVEPFAGILGRTDDILIAPDGTHLTGIDHIPRDVEHVVRMQVIQEAPDYVRIRVIPTPEFNEQDRQTILQNAALKIPSTMRVEIELGDDLERTSQGKAPFVIRRV